MQFRILGQTGLRISVISFGAGPVPAVMTSPDARSVQRAVVARAIERGVNWFDTAATYGDGQSEASLGRVLAELDAAGQVHLATKVRVPPDKVDRIDEVVRESFAGSLRRLGVPRVTLLQVHNSITRNRGDQPTSLTPADVLGTGGLLEGFRRLRDEGQVAHFGITGLGDPDAMAEVIDSGHFATIQTPFNLLNPSAGRPAAGVDADYGQILNRCRDRNMGAFAIRVFAGGALTGQPPSRHTLTTKFFPLDLYERDSQAAARLQSRTGLPPLAEVAVRFALSHPGVTSALLGFSAPEQVDEAIRACEAGPLTAAELDLLNS